MASNTSDQDRNAAQTCDEANHSSTRVALASEQHARIDEVTLRKHDKQPSPFSPGSSPASWSQDGDDLSLSQSSDASSPSHASFQQMSEMEMDPDQEDWDLAHGGKPLSCHLRLTM